jgi:trimeric autotransporter adhesin
MAMISKIFRSVALVVAGIASLSLLGTISLHAQAASSLVTNRLTAPIDDTSLVTLKGTVHPLANAANDRGPAPDSMPLDRLQIVLQRSAAQESALQQLIHDEHTPGTANYHKWLTPAQFGAQFGPSDQDVATIESWLASKGFSIEKVNPGKQTLEVSGSVAQFRTAFHSQIHKYVVNGETHYANSSDPQIPAALAPVFGGFVSLNNFHGKRQSRVLGQATYNTKTDTAVPQWTWGNSSGVNFVLAPSDFAVQYDLPSSLNGSGQTIAIINDSNINIDLVNQFRTLFSLPANPPQVIIDGNDPGVDGINNPDGPNYDSGEAYLDVEWSGAVAPAATVDLVIGADTSLESGLILAAEHAVYGNIAPVMSVSFGFGCEATLGSVNQYFEDLWEQAAAQGITVMVSAGDNASAGCDDDDTQYYAVHGAAVSGLASTPYNVAVGGTDFYYSSYNQGSTAIDNQLATYWNTTPTQNPATSILGVIPEQPWNDSQYGLNLASVYTSSGDTETSIAGGSGGASIEYSKPSWQTGTGVPSDGHRDLPDVSLFAANGLNYSFYPICYTDGDCQPPSGSNLVQITGIGGTSASSPAFAGIMALVNQKYGRQGQADYVLYPLATQFPAAFHDVTNGTNSVPCNITTAVGSSGTFPPDDCIAVTSPLTITDPNLGEATEGQIGTGTTPEYNATTGYDLASGLGSVDATQLINDWGSVVFTSTTVSLTSPTSGQTFTHGSSVSFTGTVTGSGSSTPSGNVAIETNSNEPGQQGQGFPGLITNTAPSTFTLSSGSFSGSINTLPGGTYDVWASYGGDGTDASAQSSKTQITVNPEASTTYFSVNDVATGEGAGAAIASGATVPYGTQLILAAQPVPTSYYNQCINTSSPPASCSTAVTTEPTGTVVFADNGTNVNTAVVNTEGDAEYNGGWAIGSHSVTAKYSGDNSYNPSTSSAITFKIDKDTPNINVYASLATQTSLLTGTAVTIQVLNSSNLANESAYNIGYSTPVATPTGTVTISGLPSGVPTSATLYPGVDAQTLAAVGIATINIPANTANGTYNVTVSYPGDTNYASTSTSGTLPIQTASGLASTTTATITGTISPTTTVTISGTVTGQSGHPAPSNAGGGVEIYSSGYYFIVPLVQGSGDSSTFSTTVTSQSLLQGTNAITVQFLGDATYAPSSDVIATPISNPLADFSMVPDTTIVPVTVGTAATDTIQLAPVNGFSNSASFTCKAPSGITCSLSPTSYAFSGGASSTTLTLDASASATNGANDILVTGTDSSGKYIHTLSINAIVTGGTTASAGFLFNASPATITLAQGATTGNTAAVTVTPSNGFTGNVALSATVTGPSGATSIPTVTFSSGTIDVTGQSTFNSTLTVATTSSTTIGNYTVTVTGTSGSLAPTATVTVVVTSPSAASFALASNPTSLTLSPGATSGNTTSISVTPASGFTGTVAFTCAVTSSPSGATDLPTCSAPSADVTGTAAVSSTLTVNTTAPTTSLVRHPLDKFFAASGGMALAVLFFFGIPVRRRNWRSMLAILLFAGIVGLGIGCGSGGSSTTTSGGTSSGSYVLTVTGTSGSLSETTTVNLTVN